MTISKSALDTYKLLKATATVAEDSLEGRIQHYRAHLKTEEKELRTYTQKAAADLLGCNNRTLKRRHDQGDFNDLDIRRGANGHYAYTLSNIHQMAEILGIEAQNRKPNDKLQVIIVNSLKGGCGKTTSLVNIAAALATTNIKRYRIGIIDLDPQGSSSSFFPPTEPDPITVGDLMRDCIEFEENESQKDVVSSAFLPTHIPNIRVLPSGMDDFYFEHETATQLNENHTYSENRHYHKLLEKVIQPVEDEFDIILVDTAPSLNFMFYNALMASTAMLIPVHPEAVDFDANNKFLKRLAEIYHTVAALGHEGWDFMQFVVTNYVKGNHSQRDIVKDIRSAFGRQVMSYPINHSSAITASSSSFNTIFDQKTSDSLASRESLIKSQENIKDVVDELEMLIRSNWASTQCQLESA
ncbi:AAA family ATPase [Pseudoalteromonas sp. C2R02]|uniref:AAA family ATPase n=1 Tax=Pseudoalteromonas sp. C2R02 TaxID=2841565 RepID=UPI001C0819FB|nr:AAA family ATPase [Pseudoalteromonas sp. C2R02]MBU2971965.1 AAA family ATPase [Pseudoalteromonas sp. C2R02]